jgi:amidophosphoribosyltransferase
VKKKHEDKPLRDYCGLFGILGDSQAPYLTFQGLYSLQHRGQEGSGIVTGYSDGALDGSRGLGLVTEHFNEARIKKLSGDRAIGHVRYSTVGANHRRNVQPLLVECRLGHLAVGHNGTLVNAAQLRQELEQSGAIFRTTIDTEVLIHMLARSGQKKIEDALMEQLPLLDGAYSFLVLCQGKMIAVRDPYGFRPLDIARMDNAYAASSETCAFDLIGARRLRSVEPGEMVIMDDEGMHSVRFAPAKNSLKRCIFELIYLARPDSLIFGQPVHAFRHRCGEMLAQTHPKEADLVMSVPDSGNYAAMGYAVASGIPFVHGFIRNHYVGRTFIQPSQEQRVSQLRLKLSPLPGLLKNKRLVVIDDSIVRGNTSRRIVETLRQAGAKEVHFMAASPPYRFPCYYGVDTPVAKKLIASERSIEEIRDYMGADSLCYLSIEQALQAAREHLAGHGDFDVHEQGFCVACFDGSYPTLGEQQVKKEMLENRSACTAKD